MLTLLPPRLKEHHGKEAERMGEPGDQEECCEVLFSTQRDNHDHAPTAAYLHKTQARPSQPRSQQCRSRRSSGPTPDLGPTGSRQEQRR